MTFWYLVSKKLHDHSVIIYLVRLLRCETVKIWKIHWKLTYSESLYCFANIFEMEAWILWHLMFWTITIIVMGWGVIIIYYRDFDNTFCQIAKLRFSTSFSLFWQNFRFFKKFLGPHLFGFSHLNMYLNPYKTELAKSKKLTLWKYVVFSWVNKTLPFQNLKGL